MNPHEAPRVGLTSFELILGLVLIAILAGASVGLLRSFLNAMPYLPNQTRVLQAASEILETVAEGSVTTITGAPSPTLKGLRFAKRISSAASMVMADKTELRYTAQGSCDASTRSCLVRLRLDGAANILYRSYGVGASFSAEEPIPYYATEGLQAIGNGPLGALFRYFDASGTELTAPVSAANLGNIRRVEILVLVQTGSGDFNQGDGSISATSSVAVRFF